MKILVCLYCFASRETEALGNSDSSKFPLPVGGQASKTVECSLYHPTLPFGSLFNKQQMFTEYLIIPAMCRVALETFTMSSGNR